MHTNPFVGTWKLITSEFQNADGTITYPYGPDALGLLMYDAAGNMSVQIMRANRPAFRSGDPARGTAAETQAAFDGVLTYFGQYEVDHTTSTITHHVVASTFPNWIGGDQRRSFVFVDHRLTLSSPPVLVGNDLITGVLIWERIA